MLSEAGIRAAPVWATFQEINAAALSPGSPQANRRRDQL